MFNIYKRLLEVYSDDEIKEKMDKNQYYNMKNNQKIPSVSSFSNRFDFDKISYSLDEFLEDYPKYRKFVESRSILKILKSGYTIEELMKKYNISILYKHLKNGFDYNSNVYDDKEELVKYFDIDIDLSKFKVELHRRHIELFGEKNDLEEFREKYKISHLVLLDKEKNQWHLAFDGLIYNHIKRLT